MLSSPNFSTITPERAAHVSQFSDVYWLQFFITGDCTMECAYCSGFGKGCPEARSGHIHQACTHLWPRHIRKIKLTGGEPTQHPRLLEIIAASRKYAPEVSMGTNGRSSPTHYEDCVTHGLTSATVSVDYPDDANALFTIQTLHDAGARVVAGITVHQANDMLIQKTIDAAIEHGANDCTLSVATCAAPDPSVFAGLNTHNRPILTFRARKAAVNATRGCCTAPCYMALDSMCIKNQEHYPCQIYMREGGKPIGPVNAHMSSARGAWHQQHVPAEDPICQKYCPDFCMEFNHEANTLRPPV
jgi:hypothetical protein